jgi:zinc protease
LGWELVGEYVDHLNAITPEQVQTVARKYLVPDTRTVAVLDPQPIGDQSRQTAATSGAGGHVHVR